MAFHTGAPVAIEDCTAGIVLLLRLKDGRLAVSSMRSSWRSDRGSQAFAEDACLDTLRPFKVARQADR